MRQRSLLCLVLFVLGFCVAGEARAQQVADVGKSLKELLEDAAAERPEKRKTAVKRLAERVDRAAWERVIEALEDKDSQVADTAQVVLAKLLEPKLREALFGRMGLRHEDDWIRLRVAEAFGRMTGSVDGERLAAALSARDWRVSEALLWSLERLQLRGQLEGRQERIARKVEGCMGRNAPAGLRARALYTLALVAPERAHKPLRKGLKDRAPQVRSAALQALARDARTEPELLALAIAALDDEVAGVRRVAGRVLLGLRTKEALLALVGRLDLEQRIALKRGVLADLQSATGLRYRFDARPWRMKINELHGGERFRRLASIGGAAERMSGTQKSRFPTASDRVAYLVDLSGSVWNKRADGTTRKDLVDEILQRTLETLPRESRFNVLAYTREPFAWQDELTKVGRKGVGSAMEFFTKLHVTGPGDVWTASQAVLGDPELDTVCIVTDGAPTGGHRWDLVLMVELFLQETRWLPVRFDVVLVDCPKGLERRWRDLTQRTGGELMELSFEPPQ